MNSIEDRLWDYIDGICSADERIAIEQLLRTDPEWRKKFRELNVFNQQLKSIELDEPSMGFKNRVMEEVLASPHPSTLKTKVDKRIINGIGLFFVVTILGFLGYTFSKVDWSQSSGYKMPSLSMPTISWSFLSNSSFTLFFLTTAVVLGLFLIDKIRSQAMMRKSMQ